MPSTCRSQSCCSYVLTVSKKETGLFYAMFISAFIQTDKLKNASPPGLRSPMVHSSVPHYNGFSIYGCEYINMLLRDGRDDCNGIICTAMIVAADVFR